MMPYTHIVGALDIGLFVTCVETPSWNPYFIAGLVTGSLWPDIDHPYSTISRVLKPVSRFVEMRWAHRTFLHSLLAVVIMSAILFPVQLWQPLLYKGVFYGMVAHLLLDTLNFSGVPLIWPFAKFYFVMVKDPRWCIKVGSRNETAFATFLTIVLIFVYFPAKYSFHSYVFKLMGGPMGMQGEAQKMYNHNDVVIEIDGMLSVGQTILTKERYNILAIRGMNLWIEKDGYVNVIAEFPGIFASSISGSKINLIPIRKVRRHSEHFLKKYIPFDSIQLPENTRFVDGTMQIESTPDVIIEYLVTGEEATFSCISMSEKKDFVLVKIMYATPRIWNELRGRGIFVYNADLTFGITEEEK